MKFGKVEIGNKRKGGAVFPPDYLRVDVDRKNKILGNPYILHNYLDDRERAEVIGKYQLDYEADWAVDGPMKEETLKIARLVYKGQSVVLDCWCAGKPTYKPCHAELIKEKIEQILTPYL